MICVELYRRHVERINRPTLRIMISLIVMCPPQPLSKIKITGLGTLMTSTVASNEPPTRAGLTGHRRGSRDLIDIEEISMPNTMSVRPVRRVS